MTEWVPSLLFSLVYCKHKWKRNALNCVEPRHPTWKTKTHQSHARSKCRALFLRFSPPTKKSCVCVCVRLQNKTSNYCKKESILSTVTLKKLVLMLLTFKQKEERKNETGLLGFNFVTVGFRGEWLKIATRLATHRCGIP